MSNILSGRRVDLVHRLGAAVLGGGLCVFGMLGVAHRLPFLAVRGTRVVLGLATDGLLATISLFVGGVLIGAAIRGGRSSSNLTVVIGALFLLSGLLNLAVLNTGLNLLAFRMSNVIFSFITGMLLLFLGAYGRFSGGLPTDNPYYQQRHRDALRSGAEHTTGPDSEDEELAAAELAVAEGHATPEQEHLVREDAQRRAYQERLRAWNSYQSRRERDVSSPVPPYWRGSSYRPWSGAAKKPGAKKPRAKRAGRTMRSSARE